MFDDEKTLGVRCGAATTNGSWRQFCAGLCNKDEIFFEGGQGTVIAQQGLKLKGLRTETDDKGDSATWVWK
ncbi:hypothetical protein SB766_02675 [Pseudomonas sp. SIMBA_077]